MDKRAIKTAILSAISEELDLWLEKEDAIDDGYEYESEFIKAAQKINRIILSKSLDTTPVNRNKKNSRPVLGNSK